MSDEVKGDHLALLRQQTILAKFGELALKSADSDEAARVIPNVFRAPFQSDAAHQSNLMAPRVVALRPDDIQSPPCAGNRRPGWR